MPTNYTPSQVYDKYVALQKQLATNITNKGVTASQTELYDTLIDKVAQIENLKGEERTLENFTNVLSEPKSVVQLEYPEPKNLFDKNMSFTDDNKVTDGAAEGYLTYFIQLQPNTKYYAKCFAPVTTDVTATILSSNKAVNSDVSTGIVLSRQLTGWKTELTLTTDDTGRLYVGNNANNLGKIKEIIAACNLQIELGTTATTYEPYPAPKTLNAKLGSKNLFDKTIPYSSYDTDSDVQAGGYAALRFYVGIGTPVTISFTAPTEAFTSMYMFISFSHLAKMEQSAITKYKMLLLGKEVTATTVTDTSTDGYVSFVLTQQTYNFIINNNIQIELGTTATPYTPYISDLTTVNVTRCGKNFLEYPYVETTLTRNGLTFTDNKDGTITVNGTATADTQFRLQDTVVYPNNPNPFNSLIGKKVYISGSPEGSSKDTYAIQWIQAGAYGNGTMTVTKSVYYRFAIFVKSGITVENLVFKPQIELGSTATPYEPYQGQTYTPTASGEVTGITNLYPTTTLLTNNAGVVFEQVTGGFYEEILPSTDKNGITKVYQPSVDSTIDSNITSDNIKQGVSILGVTGDYICNYTYDETTKELVLIL